MQANTKDISVGALAVYNSTHDRIIDGAICDAEANTNYNSPIVENRKISYRNGELIGHEIAHSPKVIPLFESYFIKMRRPCPRTMRSQPTIFCNL